MGDVYVLVPGILGSVLEKDGKDAFGLTAEAGFRALFSGGKTIRALHLTEDPVAVQDLDDGVRATRLAADAHLVPGLWKVDGYGKVGQFLRRRLKLVAGETYHEFPYDWRRDNRVAAHRLAECARGWLDAQRERTPDARLVLVAHSMGGLVSRYYLECLGGWADCRALITFGTPFRGSLNALDYLVNGYSKAFGLVDLTELMRSFTSVHQLLPIYPCVDRDDGTLARLVEVPGLLPGVDAGKVAAAREFHREIEEAVARNSADEAYRHNRYRRLSVVGIDQPTLQSAHWSAGKLTLLRTRAGNDESGDGTVPRVSASPREETEDLGSMFSSARHAALQNTDAVLTQLRGWSTYVDLETTRAGAPVSLAVDLDDVTPAGHAVRLGVEPSEAILGLRARLTWVGGPGAPVPPTEMPVPASDGPTTVELPAQPPGCYRVEVTGPPEVEPVSDLITVAPA